MEADPLLRPNPNRPPDIFSPPPPLSPPTPPPPDYAPPIPNCPQLETQVVQRLESKPKKPRRPPLQIRQPLFPKYDHHLDTHPTLTPIEQSFRHSFWAARRLRVAAALAAAGVSPRRQENFAQCGQGSAVYQCRDTGDLKVRASYCHDRFCQACQQSRAALIQAALHKRVPRAKCLHVVLTLRSTDAPLSDQLTALYRFAAKLRQGKFWKCRVSGGSQTVEVTRNLKTGQWHPHLHLLVHSDWLPQAELSTEWAKITGGSTIVHVSLVRSDPAAIREVTKYLSKPIHRSIDFDEPSLIELITALKGRHLIMSFGTWRKDPLLTPLTEADDRIWTFVGTLNAVAAAAAAGDAWAKSCINYLHSCHPGRERLPLPKLAPDG